MPTADAEALVEAGAAEWIAFGRDGHAVELRTAIVLPGGYTRRQEREAAELHAVQHPEETNTDPKVWERALKVSNLSKSRGALGSTGGMNTERLERLEQKTWRHVVGGKPRSKGATPDWEELTEDLPNPKTVAEIEFVKTVHRLSKATKKRRSLTIPEIAHTMNTDEANVRQILKEKKP